MESPTTVRGRVEVLFFSSPEFSTGKLSAAGTGDRVPFAGPIQVRVSESVVLHGAWVVHPKYGNQFQATSSELDQRMDASGLAHYLENNPDVEGIGPVKARLIANAFGEDFDQIIRNDPDQVAAAGSLSPETVQNLRAVWIRNGEENEAYVWLSKFGVSHAQATALIKELGSRVIEQLEANPYVIIGVVHGFGFKRTDEIAIRMGFALDHPARIAAGLVCCVTDRLNHGDCWVDYGDLIVSAHALLGGDRDKIIAEFPRVISEGTLAVTEIGQSGLVSLPHIKHMESGLFATFSEQYQATNRFFDGLDKEALADQFMDLNAPQRRALVLAMTKKLIVVSGGAGVGKTYMVSSITRLYEKHGLKVLLTAPTGKAAKRITQLVGRPASTIHRLLEFNGGEFTRDRSNPLEAALVVVDETSMVDVPLAWRLFQAIDFSRTAVVLVGDPNQLPPVGPGNVLRDLIEKKLAAHAVLDQVVRQAGVLKENSVAVLMGQVQPSVPPPEDGGASPWIVADQLDDAEDAQKYIVHLFESVLVEKLKLSLRTDVQLLAPMKNGLIGTDALNIELQRVVQKKLWSVTVPPVPPKHKPKFLVHDRVIQIKNDYDIDVMNGTIGTVISNERGVIRVKFEDKELAVEATIGNLRLAYALTIHKAQGSEFPCVIVVVHKAHQFMHHRNLFYTGVTRAQKIAIVVGDRTGMWRCAAREQTSQRKTLLSVLPRAERQHVHQM